METSTHKTNGSSPIADNRDENTPLDQGTYTTTENIEVLDLSNGTEIKPNGKHDLYEECREAMEESSDPEEDANNGDDDYSEPIIDKNEMVEASDDQDILGSPHSSFSFEDTLSDQEIDGLTNFNIILEYPQLNLENIQLLPFTDEINDWFSSKDLQQLKSVAIISKNIGTSSLESIRRNLSHLLSNVDNIHNVDGKILENILHLAYIAMGCFDHSQSQEELSEKIISNAREVVAKGNLVELLIDIIIISSLKLTDASNLQKQLSIKKIKATSKLFYYSMTVLFIVILSFNSDDFESYAEKKRLKGVISNKKLLIRMVEAINKWRWILNTNDTNNPSVILESMTAKNSDSEKIHLLVITSFQIRNVLNLFNQLIIFQFGNLQQLNSTKNFLKYKFEESKKSHTEKKGSKSESESESKAKNDKYSISALDYEYYVNELSFRYPTYTPPKYEINEIQEMLAKNESTEKYSDLINVESLLINQHQHLKSRKEGMVNFANEPPEVHIATPMPSPTLTPQHTGNTKNCSSISEHEHGSNEIKKKLYITQSNFPNIYPSSETAPKSIQEAADILFYHIKESVSEQQFTSVFEDFIKIGSRTGNNGEKSSENKFVYTENDVKENPMYEDEIRSLQYIEEFYREGLPYFNSLIFVLLKMLITNVIPSQQSSDGKTRQRTPYNLKNFQESKPYISSKLTLFEKQKLEINRLKETILKNSSSIILLLQKWFKVSHVLKFEFFTTLLFDQDFLIYLFRYLDSNKIQTYAGKDVDFKDPTNLLNNRIVYCDYKVLYYLEDYNFFLKCLSLSNNPRKKIDKPDEMAEFHSIFEQQDDTKEAVNPLSFILPFVPHDKILKVNNPNKRCCVLVSNLLQSMYYSISHFKIQRIYKLIGVRPSEILRFYLTLHNEMFFKPILKTIKLISPFIGKKWRANNMDLISFVYLFHKVGLKDPWLNNFFNAGIEENTKRGFDNEVALRSLVKFYNFKNYKDSIVKHGYSVDCMEFMNEVEKLNGDFFTRECMGLDL